MEVSLADLESLAISVGLDSLVAGHGAAGPAMWIRFESEVRAAHTAATSRLRTQGGERCQELIRLLEIEEQTRCQAFQGVLMGEVHGPVYQATVRSILEKLLAKLENWANEPALYRGAAQCLSEYMSSLNHHCDTCVTPKAAAVCEQPRGLDAIAEADTEALDAFDSSSICSGESMHSDSTHSSVPSERLLTIPESPRTALLKASSSGSITQSVPASIPVGLASSSSSNHESSLRSGLTSTPALLPEEIRKARRRESNRNASSKYRSKKTATLSTLMEDNSALRQQLVALSSQNAVLSAENKLLKQQVSFLQGILGGQPNGSGGTPTNALEGATVAASSMAFSPSSQMELAHGDAATPSLDPAAPSGIAAMTSDGL